MWKNIDRSIFVKPEHKDIANQINKPLGIGHGQTTSQPSLILDMLKLLKLRRNKICKALDVGSGSGIVSAALSCYLKKGSTVLGIDIFEKIVEWSKQNIEKFKKKNDCAGKIKMKKKNVYDIKRKNFYDRIYVGADPGPIDQDKFMRHMTSLLAKGGLCVAPINGVIMRGHPNGTWETIKMPVRFVPLLTPLQQHGGGRKNLSEKEQRQMIEDDKGARDSGMRSKKPAVTGRSNRLYKKHLFPDKKNISKNAIIVDVGSGLNPYMKNSFIAKQKNGRALDIYNVKTGPLVPYTKGSVFNATRKQLSLTKRADIVLIHNFFYLWLDTPAKLKKAYSNILKWTKKGSEIRVYPVYFGRYDVYSPTLKKWIDSKFNVKLIEPKHTSERVPMWSEKKNKIVYVSAYNNEYEAESNQTMQAMTLILTVK